MSRRYVQTNIRELFAKVREPVAKLCKLFFVNYRSIARAIPTHLFKCIIFKYSSLLAFYSILTKVSASRCQNIT